ncbi:Serine protease MucD [Candidatus Portiera aleyrodidarum]|uniref:Trypsin-like serine protease n=1 Tax=Candidatus Portiera aleyrodidarum TV TaxID=1297582 RepID=A0A8D3X8I9_9GAMM|nr:trypsin-like peptidase domain-containing protein [Candidatus Portiera aleyrodidarum]AGI27038.1 trypsin-like serine protease [Candidatus Portiera aleyrodidarum TV]CEI58997.1 Serine protease MucD [Candidatus Portiera aleyrodidarum]
MKKFKYFYNIFILLFSIITINTYASSYYGYKQNIKFPPFTTIVQNSSSSVVNISTIKNSLYSIGTGFIISNDGYILTNAHVVNDSDQIIVNFKNHTVYNAKLIGIDTKTDIALIKINEQDLPVINIGNSDNIQVGECVAAIGSPFGFDQSITSGIVSAINRTLPNDIYVPFIQTDVAINPGNSGGPLLNIQGKVIGINSQIITRSGGFMGLSFSIPINIAINIANQIKIYGKVHRGYYHFQLMDQVNL